MRRLKLEKIFEPIWIGTVQLKNHLVYPPIVTNFGSEDGYVTERIRNYYELRAKSGVALLMLGAICVDYPQGTGPVNELSIDDDRFIPKLKELVDVVHKQGTRISCQLHHAGRLAMHDKICARPMAPSAITSPGYGYDEPRELTVNEIKRLVNLFAEGAIRAKKAGFDIVDIHSCHGYLSASFLSGYANKRKDAYGGSLENRSRFFLEVVRAVREAVGPDFPVICRLNAAEFWREGGITLEETKQVAKWGEEAGLNMIGLSAYGNYLGGWPPMWDSKGPMIKLAAAIKKEVGVPVEVAGSIPLEMAEKAVKEGQVDIIGVGRQLIADPELIHKTLEGRPEDIRPCIGCNNCMADVLDGFPMRCTVNPEVSREGVCGISAAKKPKKVIIVGGGPAGMEAAVTAKSRGHDVQLYEKGDKLGGQLWMAAVAPYKSTLKDLANYLITLVKKLSAKVELGKEVTADKILSLDPDVVIVAAGVTWFVPNIPGIDGKNVVLAGDVLLGKTQVGQKVAIIGADLIASETAEYLNAQGKDVIMMRRGPIILAGMRPNLREVALTTLKSKQIGMLTGVTYRKITVEGIEIITKEGNNETIVADTVVIASGSKPNDELYYALEGRVPQLFVIGDSKKPRDILCAIREGFHIGSAV